MPGKRITISMTEEQYDNFREILPARANVSKVVADLIDMFVSASEKYGDEFILDELCNRGGFEAQTEGKNN